MYVPAPYADEMAWLRDLTKSLRDHRASQMQLVSAGLHPYQEGYLKEFRQTLRRAAQEAKTTMLGMLGEVSSGKTSLLNAMIGYPLMPVAKVVTSTCPVDLRHGKTFRLQVFSCDDDKQETILYTYEAGRPLSPDHLAALQAYAKDCSDRRVLVCENLKYCYDLDSADPFGDFDPTEPLHVGQLLLLPLCGYVGQDEALVSANAEAVTQARARLMQEVFQICDPALSYGVRIWLDSPLLQNDLVLVDLPGLGADVDTHTRITLDYLRRVDCYILVFGDADGSTRDECLALDKLMQYKKLKTVSRDARFLVAMNKCDRIGDPADLAQCVQQIKTRITQFGVDQVIPVSAHYADARLVAGGVALERTKCWPEALQDARAYARRRKMKGEFLTEQEVFDMAREDAAAQLQAQYAASFSYQDPTNGQTVSCSTQAFIEQTIGQYGLRVQLLKELYQLSALVEAYDMARSDLNVQSNLLRMLRVYGDDLMRKLLKEVHTALSQSQVDFVNQTHDARLRIDQSVLTFATEHLQPICEEYTRQLDKAREDMNVFLEGKLGQMQSDFLGRYLVDDATPAAKGNQGLYKSLIQYFEAFDLTPYLSSGNTQLAAEIDRESQWYVQCKKTFLDGFAALISNTEARLNRAYAKFRALPDVQAIGPQEWAAYDSCFGHVKGAILTHLGKLKDQMSQQMQSDERIDQAIGATAEKVLTFFDQLTTHYRVTCVSFLRKWESYTFWALRDTLQVKQLRRHINEPFYTSDQNRAYVSKLQDHFSDPATGHASALKDAVDAAFGAFTAAATNKIDEFFPTIESSVKNLFGQASPAILARFARLGCVESVLLESLASMQARDGEALSMTLAEALDQAAQLPWAAGDAAALQEAIRREAGAARTFLEAMEKEAEKGADRYGH